MKTDDIVQLQNAFAAGAGTAPSGCVAPELIWAASRGELSASEVREVVDHTAACPSCAADWRLAVAFFEESAAGEWTPAAAPVRRFAAARLLRSAGVAAAAAMVVAVAGITLINRSAPPDQPVFRAGEEERIGSLIAADATLPRDRCLLAWTPGPPGTTYDLEVSTSELQVVVQATGLARPAYRVAETSLAGLPSPTTLLWRVEARTPAGARLTSPTFVTQVR